MGQYFMMSKRFNKQTPSDFGLLETDVENCAMHPKDNSKWMRCSLYNLGWGNEIGYYRMPLPNFSQLLQILMESNDLDDTYGAAAIIMDKFPDNLLEYCEILFSPPVNKDVAKKLIKILRLDQCINRNSIQRKSFEEVSKDYMRWQEVSRQDLSLTKKQY